MRGHNVTLITTDPTKNSSLTNLTEIDVHDVTYNIWKSSGIIKLMQKKNVQRYPFSVVEIFLKVFADITDAIMQQEEVQKLLENETQFDLVITEPIVYVGLGFACRYKSKLILVMSLEAPSYLHAAVGNPVHPVLYPEAALPFVPNTYFKRMFAVVHWLLYTIFLWNIESSNIKLLKKHFGEEILGPTEILEKANMIFVNVNPIFGGIRPVTPATVYFGRGSHLHPEKPLPEVSDFQDT